MAVSEADNNIIYELNGLIRHCKGKEAAFEHASPAVIKDAIYEGYVDERTRHYGGAAHELQTEVKRLGGEPDAPTSSNGGGLKSMIAGKDDAAVLDVLEREIVETLREYHNAKTEILRVRSDNTDLAYELLDKHVKRLEEARKELKDLSIMLDCM